MYGRSGVWIWTCKQLNHVETEVTLENLYPTSLVLYSATLLSSRCELHISDVLDYVPLILILLCRDHEAVHRMTSVLVFKVYVLMNII